MTVSRLCRDCATPAGTTGDGGARRASALLRLCYAAGDGGAGREHPAGPAPPARDHRGRTRPPARGGRCGGASAQSAHHHVAPRRAEQANHGNHPR
eukprot:651994-Pyramimonas_sp.AAC.1